MSLSPVDLTIVAVYLVGCTALGAWLGRSGRGVKDYFLGERDLPAWAVMISIVATETSAVTFLSVPGNAYRGDWTFLQLAMGYILARFVVAFVLLPLYFRGQIQTAYEVLAIRFGGSVRTAASVLFLVSRTIGAGLRLFLAAAVLYKITGWDIRLSILIIGGSTILYTFLGGLKGVVWADVLQFAIYMMAAIVALWIIGGKVDGGWLQVLGSPQLRGKIRIWNFSTDLTISYTFWAGVVGGLVLDMGSHGADHMMVQRYLSAKSQRQAAWALIASGFVIFAQFLLFLLIGTGLYALDLAYPPAHIPRKDLEFATFLVMNFPTGLLGLVIAAIFAVTMSTASGALSASASSSVNDLIRPLFPQDSEKNLLRTSRGMTVFWGVAQIAVAMAAIGLNQSVIDAALAVAGFVVGILLGLFLLGLWTKDVGQSAALLGVAAGLAAVSSVAFGTKLAYPWYALVGSSSLFLVGILAQQFLPRDPRHGADDRRSVSP